MENITEMVKPNAGKPIKAISLELNKERKSKAIEIVADTRRMYLESNNFKANNPIRQPTDIKPQNQPTS